MYKQSLSSPMFSLALQRGTSAGYIAFGGLPPVNFDKSSFSNASIQMTSISNIRKGGKASGYAFYTITPDAMVYQGAPSSNTDAYIVDSGTTLFYMPSAAAQAVNNLFSPAAQLLSNQGGYFVNCKATTPSIGVKIGGTTFQINEADLIYQNVVDSATGLCMSGIQDGGSSGPYILGDVFLQNVVAVFDIGAAQMRFAAHNY
jgi:hypothetical protein